MEAIIAPNGRKVNYCFRMEAEAWDNEEFAAFVRSELRRREWVQSDLARRAGVPTGSLTRWLNGTRRPKPESVLRLADALNADPDAVLAMVGHREEVEPASPDELSRVHAMLRRIDLSKADRLNTLEAILNLWIDSDRRRSADG